MTERTCATCRWWDQGGSPLAADARAAIHDPAFGICRSGMPQIVVSAATDWRPVSMQPETHETCYCALWEPEDDDDGDDGERQPETQEAEVVVPFRHAA